MKIVVAGGAGALGRRLCADLADRGHEVVVLSRSARGGPHRTVEWDGRTVGKWAHELAGSAVVNLAGALVDRRPTAANIALLERSRVEPTAALARAAANLAEPIPVWVQASTTAIYGNAGEKVLDESSPVADGPPQMAGVARAWEESARNISAVRRVFLRTSIVLDRDTPALDRLVGMTKAGLGGRVGTGRQWFSWIHIADWLAITRYALSLDRPARAGSTPDGTAPDGVIAATSPYPVRNHELMAALRKTLRRPPAPPTPAAVVRLGAMVLRTDPALALTGRRVVPTHLQNAGFTFAHPRLDEALADVLHN